MDHHVEELYKAMYWDVSGASSNALAIKKVWILNTLEELFVKLGAPHPRVSLKNE